MITSTTNYTDTLDKIEKLKLSIKEVETNIYSQIPQGITNEFDKSKLSLLNWLEEMEVMLMELQEK
ncbi:hypothetical protein VB776_19295 [Arcicella sp. DC2W]|uniref:Uncharacterized protein n=1 Tax=Arcicella gelida TaxID=2984195 RepID=A0ABU5S9D6_9BACT|nr:hypothetical protein [Arcicella sp. DC2W]MEA5405089.1 hypothetical protein [Arcicella sp. DC2W]